MSALVLDVYNYLSLPAFSLFLLSSSSLSSSCVLHFLFFSRRQARRKHFLESDPAYTPNYPTYLTPYLIPYPVSRFPFPSHTHYICGGYGTAGGSYGLYFSLSPSLLFSLLFFSMFWPVTIELFLSLKALLTTPWDRLHPSGHYPLLMDLPAVPDTRRRSWGLEGLGMVGPAAAVAFWRFCTAVLGSFFCFFFFFLFLFVGPDVDGWG